MSDLSVLSGVGKIVKLTLLGLKRKLWSNWQQGYTPMKTLRRVTKLLYMLVFLFGITNVLGLIEESGEIGFRSVSAQAGDQISISEHSYSTKHMLDGHQSLALGVQPTEKPHAPPLRTIREEILRLVEAPVFPHRNTSNLLPGEVRPLREKLVQHIAEWLEKEPLAPLVVDIGLAGREVFFAHSGEIILALSLSLPHLEDPLRQEVVSFLDVQWEEHFPLGSQRWYPPGQGKRRERHPLPPGLIESLQPSTGPHPFANMYAVWSYAFYADRWDPVAKTWPEIRRCWEDFRRLHLPLQHRRDALWANAYLAGMIGLLRIARTLEREVEVVAGIEDAEQLARWCLDRFRRDVARLPLPIFENVGHFDRWRAEDMGGFFIPLPPHHKAKPDKFHGLTPEVGVFLARQAPESVNAYLEFVGRTLPGWYLVGEERQLHFGENFVDYPDFSLSIFQAQALLGGRSACELACWVDMPWCVGDAYFVQKLAICLHLSVSGIEIVQAGKPGN